LPDPEEPPETPPNGLEPRFITSTRKKLIQNKFKIELRDRVTEYERNHNISRFIFSTPFTTVEGSAHGELQDQYKRKTILTTVNHFPYIKTRIQVIDRKQIVLTPIEVAIEDIQLKVAKLAAAIKSNDPKILQMELQGSIGTTVNQGPMEVARVFLRDILEGKTPTKYENKLRLCFKDLLKKSGDALKRNRQFIKKDQELYQNELENSYHRCMEYLKPLLHPPPCPANQHFRSIPEAAITSPVV
ncbi:dedicator of cytokinesis protein 7, partial [Eurytemora carolleeae]|uniref:dedicator of cytokinesis protein 7 n=1 Tax=Eurytemora carolleeae TaxID=1294199 RepID=UPI000C789EBA